MLSGNSLITSFDYLKGLIGTVPVFTASSNTFCDYYFVQRESKFSGNGQCRCGNIKNSEAGLSHAEMRYFTDGDQINLAGFF